MPEPPPPQVVAMQMINGKVVSRCVSLVCEIGIADLLKDGPKHIDVLAAESDSHPDALYRVLRMLAGGGAFEEAPGRRFANNAVSEAFRSDTQGSVRDFARWYGVKLHWKWWADLDYSVRTGKPSLTKDHPGKDAFDVLAADDEAQSTFNEAMTGFSLAEGSLIMDAGYPWGSGRIVDVAGGHGALAKLISRASPEAQA